MVMSHPGSTDAGDQPPSSNENSDETANTTTGTGAASGSNEPSGNGATGVTASAGSNPPPAG